MIWILALTACLDIGGLSSSDDTATPGVSDDTGGASAGDTADTADTGFLPAGVQGRVVGAGGQPLEDILVTLCRGACVSDNSDAEGTFQLVNVRPDNYPISFVDQAGQYGVATPLFLLPVDSGEEIQLSEDMVMPLLEPLVAMPAVPGDVEIVPGVTLTVDPAQLWLAPWEPSDAVQGARAPTVSALVPFPDVLAVWYLAPFKSLSSVPMPLTLANDWGLGPGETVEAWVASYFYAEWVEAGTLTVSADGERLEGAAIEELTTLVIARTVPGTEEESAQP